MARDNSNILQFAKCRGCRTGDDEDFDLVPPLADRAPEPVRLRLHGTPGLGPASGISLHPVSRCGRIGKRVDGQQGPELLLDQTCRL